MSFEWISGATVERLGWTLVHSVWIGAVAGVVHGGLMGVLRRGSAQGRYVAGCAVMGLFMAGVVAASVLQGGAGAVSGGKSGDLRSGAMASGGAAGDAGRTRGGAMMMGGGMGRDAASPGESRYAVGGNVGVDGRPPQGGTTNLAWRELVIGAVEPVLPWGVLGWGCGVGVLGVWQFWGWVGIWRMRRGARAVEAGLRARVEELARRINIGRVVGVMESALVRVPTVVGWLKPVILLPAGFALGLSAGQVEAILVHELAHIRRHDYLVNMVQTLVETVLFYHPATWVIGRRIRREREHCCDDAVMALGADGWVYAESLLEVARQSAGRRAMLGMAATGKKSELRMRIMRLVGEEGAARGRHWPVVLAALLVGVGLLVPVACMKMGSRGGQEGSTSVSPGVRRQAAELAIINIRFGNENGLMTALGLSGAATCGHPGNVSEVHWRFVESSPAGDVYHFTRRFPADTDHATTVERDITYAGMPVTVFEDDVQRILVHPRSGTEAAGTAMATTRADGGVGATTGAGADARWTVPGNGGGLQMELFGVAGDEGQGRLFYAKRAGALPLAESDVESVIVTEVDAAPGENAEQRTLKVRVVLKKGAMEKLASGSGRFQQGAQITVDGISYMVMKDAQVAVEDGQPVLEFQYRGPKDYIQGFGRALNTVGAAARDGTGSGTATRSAERAVEDGILKIEAKEVASPLEKMLPPVLLITAKNTTGQPIKLDMTLSKLVVDGRAEGVWDAFNGPVDYRWETLPAGEQFTYQLALPDELWQGKTPKSVQWVANGHGSNVVALTWIADPTLEQKILGALANTTTSRDVQAYLHGLRLLGKPALIAGLKDVLKPDRRAFTGESSKDITRLVALQLVAQYKFDGLAPEVKSCLKDDSVEVVKASLTAIIALPAGRVAGTADLMPLAGNKDSILRRYVAGALGQAGGDRGVAVALLHRMIVDEDGLPPNDFEEHAFVKIWACQSLGKLNDRSGVAVLIDLLQNEASRNFRGNITYVLHEITGQSFDSDKQWIDWWKAIGAAAPAAGMGAAPKDSAKPAEEKGAATRAQDIQWQRYLAKRDWSWMEASAKPDGTWEEMWKEAEASRSQPDTAEGQRAFLRAYQRVLDAVPPKDVEAVARSEMGYALRGGFSEAIPTEATAWYAQALERFKRDPEMEGDISLQVMKIRLAELLKVGALLKGGVQTPPEMRGKVDELLDEVLDVPEDRIRFTQVGSRRELNLERIRADGNAAGLAPAGDPMGAARAVNARLDAERRLKERKVEIDRLRRSAAQVYVMAYPGTGAAATLATAQLQTLQELKAKRARDAVFQGAVDARIAELQAGIDRINAQDRRRTTPPATGAGVEATRGAGPGQR